MDTFLVIMGLLCFLSGVDNKNTHAMVGGAFIMLFGLYAQYKHKQDKDAEDER